MSYSVFASYYDELTRNVGYGVRADYLCTLLKRHGHQPGLTLDLACGTGSLTIELAQRGFDIYGIDSSFEMLSVAQQKAAEAKLNLLFLCQKMQSIDLYGTVDTVFCVLDSINHLTSEKEVLDTFQQVSLFLNPGGYFIFDVNTIYKHQKVLADHTFVYDLDEVFCVWQNQLEEKTKRVRIDLDFFVRSGSLYQRSSEHFYERAYGEEQLRSMLEETGFQVEAVYGDLTFEIPHSDEERILFVAKKKE